MNRAEIMEIKKRFKIKDCSFSGFSYYVTSNVTSNNTDNEDGQIYQEEAFSDKFLTQPAPVQKKYLSLISKAYSSAGGAFAEDISVDGDDKKLLTALSKGYEPDRGLVKSLADKISENYDTEDPFAVVIFSDAYDIPQKDTAKTRTGESEEVYSYVAICICPFKPSGGGIILTKEGNLEASDVFKTLGNPVAGFIYPSFNERSSDYEHMYVAVKEESERELLRKMYGCDIPAFEKAKKAPKKDKEEVKEASVKDSNTGYSEYHEEHVSRSEDADSTIRQNAAPSISSAVRKEEEMPLYNATQSKTEPVDDSISDYIDTKISDKDTVSVSTDRIIERDVNGTKFFMVPETLISYDKLKALIEEGNR